MRFIEKPDYKLSVSKWQCQLSVVSTLTKRKASFYFR